MSADRLLGTLLRSLQTYTDQQDTPRFLSTAASLLVSLNNPLNITLLTSQLLNAPALWHRPEGLQTCLRLMEVFHSAALSVLKREDQDALDAKSHWYPAPSSGIPKNTWIRAVIKGAIGAEDGTGHYRAPAWKSVMVVTGLLLGFGPREEEGIDFTTRALLEQELVKGVNKGLEEVRAGEEELAGQALCLALNHVFPMIADFERNMIDYDMLLPVLIGSTFFSNEGLQGAYFLGAIDLDCTKTADGKLNWKQNSTSFHNVQTLLNRPLISSLGPLSRLIAHAVEHVRDSYLVLTLAEDLSDFAKSLLIQWRQNRISNVDVHEEPVMLSTETTQVTMPQLWKLLRACLFALTIIFRGVVGRMLGDRRMASDATAPQLACQILNALRSLFFITSRIGTHSFSQYTFVYLTCIDILSAYPSQAEGLLHSIKPITINAIPTSPVDRALALYFLNTAEHFSLILSPTTNEDFLVASALPYLASGGAKHLLPLFEAAHSVMLSVLSAPQSAETAAKHAPFYVDALFSAFPENLSPRQFRLAFKTLIRVTTPPSSLSRSHPDLPAILLELLHHRGMRAPTKPLPQAHIPSPLPDAEETRASPPLSERAVIALTLLDSLPSLPVEMLTEWLPLAAHLVNAVPAGPMLEACRQRFWEVLVGGEMDPERALVCVSWWNCRGGREAVMGLVPDEELMMSGALPVAEAKL